MFGKKFFFLKVEEEHQLKEKWTRIKLNLKLDFASLKSSFGWGGVFSFVCIPNSSPHKVVGCAA